jgi:elongation factor Tu
MTFDHSIQLVVLGQAGHGKSTLTAAVTHDAAKNGRGRACSYNELDAGAEQSVPGGTAKLSLVEFSTQRRGYRLADFPTHTDCATWLSAMGSQTHAAIFVISAVDGVMPEAEQEILLARKAGVAIVVVYLSKCDLVDDDDALDLVTKELRSFLDRCGYDGSSTSFIRGSALGALNGMDDKFGLASVHGLLDALDNDVPDAVRA